MRLTFLGVRGSTPAPGADFVGSETFSYNVADGNGGTGTGTTTGTTGNTGNTTAPPNGFLPAIHAGVPVNPSARA